MVHSKTIVKGSSVSREGFYVSLACAFIVAAALVLIGVRRTSYKIAQTGENEISVFEALNPLEQGLYADLSTASEDILLNFKENGEFMSVKELEEQFIPPFVKDSAWISRGEHAWLLSSSEKDEQALYVGLPESNAEGEASKVGAFVLLVKIKGESEVCEVWYHARDEKIASPRSFEDFVKYGWKKCVSHTGQSEKERIKGE